ncbi:MAG: DUF423 domain-containing protein [Bacteroidota bacterium]
MNTAKISFLIGAFLGLTGVIAGAMGAHALEKVLTPDQLDAFETAVRFQMYHSILLLLLGLLEDRFRAPLFRWVMTCWVAGIVMFSGSIYLLVLTPLKLGIVTPIGGSILIVGWGILLLWGIRFKQTRA